MRLIPQHKIIIYKAENISIQISMEAIMFDNNSNLVENPISELVNDETYEMLKTRGLIDEKSVRDYLIKKRFRDMRESKMRASEAIDSLREDYPYLQFDTIRKIVYQTS